MEESYLREYERFEFRHWWFVARRELICHWMDRYAVGQRWLDVGCGTGVLLESYGGIKEKIGVEVEELCVSRARSKGLDVSLDNGDWDLGKEGGFDLITMCDVLEHVEDDRRALPRAWEALREGGTVLVTVPALPSLWSGHDVVNHHYRRYTRRSLLERFDLARWDVLRVSYFSTLLLPAIWGVRKLKKLRGAGSVHDFRFGWAWVDRLLLGIFRTEGKLMRLMDMPVGSSLILVARKKQQAQA